MLDEIISQMAKKVVSKADLDDLADRVRPAVVREIEKGVIAAVKEMDWHDVAYDIMNSDEIVRAIKKKIGGMIFAEKGK